MKILITVSPIYREAVQKCIAHLEGRGLQVYWLGRPDEQLGEEELLELLDGAEIYVVGNAKVPRRVIESSPQLRMISKYGVGVDNIDLAAAKERGILVTNAPGANAISVAEMTLGMLLSLTRRLKESERTLREGGWRVTVGYELYGRTLGIIGLGNIGKQVAIRARAFGMRVISNDIVEYAEFCREHKVEPMGLEEVLEQSDMVTLHVPLTRLTWHMIDDRRLSRMKRGAFLLQTARGGVVDEQALYRALVGGQVAGAAVDVFEHEPLGESPLRGLEQVILTPHVAGITYDAAERIARLTVVNVEAYLERQEPPNLLN